MKKLFRTVATIGLVTVPFAIGHALGTHTDLLDTLKVAAYAATASAATLVAYRYVFS